MLWVAFPEQMLSLRTSQCKAGLALMITLEPDMTKVTPRLTVIYRLLSK
jgi:hypothetical protein